MATAVQSRPRATPSADVAAPQQAADVFVRFRITGDLAKVPPSADQALAGYGRWHEPWIAS